jgi:hypothetical protein
VAEFGQHRRLENVSGGLQRRSALFHGDLGQIIRDGGADRIGAGTDDAVIGKACPLAPAP